MTDVPLPRITVVTPSFNQARYIEQEHGNLEYIVMDGGSTDGSAEIIAKFDRSLAYWCSQKDAGQSHAIHDGFMRGTGDILTWLNSDDILLPGTLHEVARIFARDRSCQFVFGNFVWISASGEILHCRKGEGFWSVLPRMGILAAYGPSAFFSRKLYTEVGGLNTDLHYMMDTEMWWRFVMAGARFRRMRRYSWALRLHAEAKVSGHLFQDRSSAQLAKTEQAQSVEREYLSKLIQPYCRPWPKPVSGLVQAARRMSSPQYMRGIYDDMLWRGKPIERLMQSQ